MTKKVMIMSSLNVAGRASYFYCSICQKDCNIESMGVSAITAHQNCKAPGMALWGHCVHLPPTRNGKKCKKLP